MKTAYSVARDNTLKNNVLHVHKKSEQKRLHCHLARVTDRKGKTNRIYGKQIQITLQDSSDQPCIVYTIPA
jgi:hypothetical protein